MAIIRTPANEHRAARASGKGAGGGKRVVLSRRHEKNDTPLLMMMAQINCAKTTTTVACFLNDPSCRGRLATNVLILDEMASYDYSSDDDDGER